MSGIIKAEIYFDGEYYCARTLDIDVFTQDRTIDEVSPLSNATHNPEF